MRLLRLLISVLCVCSVLLAANASGTSWAEPQQPSTTRALRAETEILKTIVFITIEAKEPDQPKKPGKLVTFHGTGFLVSVSDTRLKDAIFVYIVTNRHVALAAEQDQKGNLVPLQILKSYVTLNLKEPLNGKRSDRVDISDSQRHEWHFPADESSDLAVMPFGVSAKYDFRVVSSQQLLTSEILDKQQVVPGDRVLTGGFFLSYAGLHEIQPILREGILAMLPDGPMTTTTGKPGNVYLADVHVIPGNSGSPIFIIPALPMGSGVTLGGAPNTFGLLGVVSGYMYETEDMT
jgi:hypothetical protein